MWICKCLQLQNVNRKSENPFGGSWVETCGRTTDGGHKQAHTAGRIKESHTDRHGLVRKLSYTSQSCESFCIASSTPCYWKLWIRVPECCWEVLSLWRGVRRRGMWLARALSENEWFSLYRSPLSCPQQAVLVFMRQAMNWNVLH